MNFDTKFKLDGVFKRKGTRSFVHTYESYGNLYHLIIVSLINCETSSKCLPNHLPQFKIKEYNLLYHKGTKKFAVRIKSWKVK